MKKKTRGPTRCLKIIGLETGEKLHVEFDEDFQPIGENSTNFIWFLGQTIRNRTCCPLQVKEWKNIEDRFLDHMWDVILVSLKLLIEVKLQFFLCLKFCY